MTADGNSGLKACQDNVTGKDLLEMVEERKQCRKEWKAKPSRCLTVVQECNG